MIALTPLLGVPHDLQLLNNCRQMQKWIVAQTFIQ